MEVEESNPLTGEEPVAPHAEPIEQVSLEEEREKHRKRAEKFGIDYVDPAKAKPRAFKHQILAERYASGGFTTGFDLFTEEEAEKREVRAARFNLENEPLWKGPAERQEDNEKRRQRAERFGTTYEAPDETGLMDVDLFEERKEAPMEATRRPEAVHIYGVDLLSTRDLLQYFGDYGPKYIEWLNDSSANVIFNDEATSKRAIAGLGSPLSNDDLPEGALSDPQSIQYLWHKGKDFHKAGSDIPLVFRIATVLDVKPSERVQSRRLWVGLQSRGGRGKKQHGRGSRKSFRGSRGGVKKHSGKNRRSIVNMHDDRCDEELVKGRGQVKYDDLF